MTTLTFDAVAGSGSEGETATVTTAATRGSTLLQRIRQALVVRRQRRALLSLDARMLADVGLSQADVYREAHRPFLDVPAQTVLQYGR